MDFSEQVPLFHVFRVADVPTTAIKCRHSFGTYNYGAGVCTEMQVVDSVCVKIARAGVGEAAHWAPDRQVYKQFFSCV